MWGFQAVSAAANCSEDTLPGRSGPAGAEQQAAKAMAWGRSVPENQGEQHIRLFAHESNYTFKRKY